MLLVEAIAQAQRVQGYLVAFREHTILETADALRTLDHLTSSTTFAKLFSRATRTEQLPSRVVPLFENLLLELVTSIQDNRTAIIASGTYPTNSNLDDPLRGLVVGFNRAHEAAVSAISPLGPSTVFSLLQRIRDPDYPPAPQPLPFRFTPAIDAIDALHDSFLRLHATTQAWLRFEVPNEFEPEAHFLAFRFGPTPLTISQASAWLTFLDGYLTLALAASGYKDMAASVFMQRFETGSFVHWLTVIPKEAWQAVVSFIRRGADIEGHEVTLDRGRTAAIGDMMALMAQSHAMEQQQLLTEEEGRAIRRKLQAIHDIPIRERALIVEADGEILRMITVARDQPTGDDQFH